MSALLYRRDIDGLRAIAVSLVILFHYQFPFVSGGFVGVDVFFVISGFLITGLLLQTMRNGKFTYAGFYARRIRRLLPAFLFVSLITFLVISRYYMDDDYYIFSKSWLASIIGLSNFYYLGELSQYFSADAKVISLLHTWSLAVEEQFYFFWPLLLLLIRPFVYKRYFVAVFVVSWLAAFAWSIWYALNSPQAAYFLLPARIFELMLGGGLALFAERLPRLGPKNAELLSLLGLVMIIASALLLTEHSVFPGYNALWPTAGATLIIYTGMSSHPSRVKKVLGSPGFVFVGGLSYSMYLWHWPPLALLNYQLIELTMTIKLSLVVFSLLAAWFTFRFIENRFRYRRWSFRKTFLWLIFLPCFLVWIVQVTIRTGDDLSFRIPEQDRALYKILQQQNAGDLYDACFDGDDYNFEQGAPCLFGNKTTDGKPNSVLIGDSHATSMIGFLETLVADTDFYFLAITKASSPFIIEEYAREALGKEKKVQRSKAIQEYLSKKPMTVFINNWWSAYMANPRYPDYMMATIDWLLKQGHQVVVLEDAPGLPSQAHAYCLLKGKTDCAIDRAEVDKKLTAAIAFKARVQKELPRVIWINPRQAICHEQQCETVLDGIPLYRDENHLNYLGSKMLGEAYLRQLGNPLQNLPPQWE